MLNESESLFHSRRGQQSVACNVSRSCVSVRSDWFELAWLRKAVSSINVRAEKKLFRYLAELVMLPERDGGGMLLLSETSTCNRECS